MAYTEKNYATEIAGPRTSPFDALAGAISHLEKASGLAGELANAMVGPVATAAGGEDGASTSGGGGLIDQIERYAAAIDLLAGSIIEDIDRVQRRL